MPRLSRLGRWVVTAVAAVILLGLLVAAVVYVRLSRHEPAPVLADDQENFLYGSIGSEAEGIPYWVWLALPRVFPEYLPGAGGYASLGFDTRNGRELPIGMSRAVSGGVPRVGINCAFCHTARVRVRPGEVSTIVPAAPGHQTNWEGYRRFLVAAASDPRFTADTLLGEIDRNYRLSRLDRLLYQWIVIPRSRKALLALGDGMTPSEAAAVPGRSASFGMGTLPRPVNTPTGPTSDMMPLWALGRTRSAFYWDGINTKLPEVVAAWALASGAPADWVSRHHGGSGDDPGGRELGRVQRYLEQLPAPTYPLPIDAALARTGASIFNAECASCHAAGGPRTGRVVPHGEIGTDRARLDAWTAEAAVSLNNAFPGRAWAFASFTKTGGFVAPSLDGVWVRAPYLHNGSVPSLQALLDPPDQRPTRFWRGHDLLDPVAVGFVSSGADAERAGTLYDTAVPGNGNGGHPFGTALPGESKRALIEFLKGL